MPNEHPPKQPLPDWYAPPHSKTHTLKDTDTWETIAALYHLDVKQLIKFNFHTTVPEEVNWYLRRRTGCKVPSPSGLNWRFSSPRNSNPSAPFPGIIHIPIKVMYFDGEELEGTPGVEQEPGEGMDEWFSHHGVHLVHIMLDGIEWSEVAAQAFHLISETGLLEGALTVAGPAVALIGLGIILGIGGLEAMEQIKYDEALWGLSYGVVLGAGGAPKAFLKMHHFLEHPRHSITDPEQEKNFDLAYKRGFVGGYVFGKKLNSAQRVSLFKKIRAALRTPAPNFEKWTAGEAEKYYREMGVAFRRYILKM